MDIDWQRILLNGEPYSFMLEIAFRTFFMFLVIVICLRVSGKRGVKQLSIFEMVMIIAMGSAAGDPMFYKDVGLVHALLVFIVILITYRLIIRLIATNERAELLFEGKPIYVVEDGKMALHRMRRDNLGIDEFFAELRSKSIEHLGQVRYAILETNGTISVYFFTDDEVQYGLPILPDVYWGKSDEIKETGYCACSFCGNVKHQEIGCAEKCSVCRRNSWVKAINTRRIT